MNVPVEVALLVVGILLLSSVIQWPSIKWAARKLNIGMANPAQEPK